MIRESRLHGNKLDYTKAFLKTSGATKWLFNGWFPVLREKYFRRMNRAILETSPFRGNCTWTWALHKSYKSMIFCSPFSSQTPAYWPGPWAGIIFKLAGFGGNLRRFGREGLRGASANSQVYNLLGVVRHVPASVRVGFSMEQVSACDVTRANECMRKKACEWLNVM